MNCFISLEKSFWHCSVYSLLFTSFRRSSSWPKAAEVITIHWYNSSFMHSSHTAEASCFTGKSIHAMWEYFIPQNVLVMRWFHCSFRLCRRLLFSVSFLPLPCIILFFFALTLHSLFVLDLFLLQKSTVGIKTFQNQFDFKASQKLEQKYNSS